MRVRDQIAHLPKTADQKRLQALIQSQQESVNDGEEFGAPASATCKSHGSSILDIIAEQALLEAGAEQTLMKVSAAQTSVEAIALRACIGAGQVAALEAQSRWDPGSADVVASGNRMGHLRV